MKSKGMEAQARKERGQQLALAKAGIPWKAWKEQALTALEFSDWYTRAKAKSTIAALRERLEEQT